MKQFFLLLVSLFLTFQFYAQIQGPPPPCGIFGTSICDPDGDGYATFDLTEAFPFETFCAVNQGEVEEDYHDIVYYSSEEDMNNETNPIANPEAFVNTIINSQSIYYRVNAINLGGNFEYLTAENVIKVTNLFNNYFRLSVYDNDSDGMAVFDLTSIDLFCGSTNESDFTISYHVSKSEAEDGTNAISNPSSFTNTVNPQTIYVRVQSNNSGNVEIATIRLTVLFAVANSPGEPFVCVENNSLDLYSFNSTVLGDQNADNFTVSYYLSETDAQNKTNSLAQFYSVEYPVAFNPYTFFVRVEENASGSYDIAEFTTYVFHKPTASTPTVLEVCDDNSQDGVAIFDLGSKSAEIINGQEDSHVWYYLTQEDAENQVNSIADENNFQNTVDNNQTIYARVENIYNNGCYSDVVRLDLVVVSDCSTRGIIKINAFNDEDKNATFENDEIKFLNGVLTYEKNNDGIFRNLHSSNGDFSIISEDENDTYDISYSILDEYDACYDITTASYENISVSNGNTVNYNFPITKTSDCGDIAVYLISYVPPRPGFDYRNYLVVQNKGLETVASGTVEFTMDANLTLTSVTGVDTGNTITNTASGFNLNFVNLAPNESEVVYLNMNVPIPTPLGTLLTNTASYSVTDLSLDNNTTSLTETVVGSYDPNDINESHGPDILHSSFSSDDYLFYTIRFQNIGTADAINVSIDNTLDSQLDASTIQMLSSSHTSVFTRTGSQLNWQFDNIHLPGKDDEPNSHGYVYYKIKPKAGYAVGDVIPNTAEIYFDFNPAVITNTFETEFTSLLSTRRFNKNDVALYPNPAQDEVKLIFNKSFNDSVLIKIYNIQGEQIVKEYKNFDANSLLLNVKELSKGVYFLQANFNGNEIVKKLVIN